MRLAIKDAGIDPDIVDYVNAHATGTVLGDAAESEGIAALFGKKPLVSSLKGHLGHTMAASGAIETVATVAMLKNGLVIPTQNLINVAPDCASINHVSETGTREIITALKNNFALGGINTCLVIRRYDD